MTIDGWDPARLPEQSGRVIAVTGANAGLGFFTSLQLARAGARVVLVCRDEMKAARARAAIQRLVRGADVSVVRLDTADLGSVRSAAKELSALDRLDVLVTNAGIVHPPRHRTVTADGLELVGATNHFGHFALVARLIDVLERTPGARVVTLGSLATRLVRLDADDLQLERRYTGWQAYAQSKIMSWSFGLELDRRLRAAGAETRALVAHPGYSITGRTPLVRGVNEPSTVERFVDNLQAVFTQGKDRGAWPTVRAAVDPLAQGGDSFGPRYRVKGAPVLETPAAVVRDPDVAAAIWAESERATGLSLLHP
ncbi:NAD(P)-dependent dehydrogenase (short-subunit alcohol dehydrogenase family) [Labedella gwakjiensis]|uniref:NAD(P)-dependent dehydrogenase (Short-subunit alcohol dehydrogenase family) n=1 Tax=Labedella gwakjiensis TaxID=390269 RepID=A0A2P8GX49_9MICO|nr:oxidoreductase [Labedella gwakjiensis]PSL38540.1 NAD(P)-dependent dehydrogenase (short-subunit alcohol dehydrogenase family) [Labedella gwakjiensis]RUQ86950.1 SDR family NAD(P)-dependent oxidoreductase [Labedella gwakjiensis]